MLTNCVHANIYSMVKVWTGLAVVSSSWIIIGCHLCASLLNDITCRQSKSLHCKLIKCKFQTKAAAVLLLATLNERRQYENSRLQPLRRVAHFPADRCDNDCLFIWWYLFQIRGAVKDSFSNDLKPFSRSLGLLLDWPCRGCVMSFWGGFHNLLAFLEWA